MRAPDEGIKKPTEIFAVFGKCGIFALAIPKNGALVQPVRIRACHARGQGFESPTHRQQTEGKIPRGKEQETRQFTTVSFFVSPHRMAVRTGKGKADKGTSTSIREGVRLPEQGGGLTPERKSPRTPTLRFRERKTIGCSGESARRPRRIHPHPRREAGKQRTGRRGQGTAHLPGGTYPAAAQPDTAGKRQKNITELFAGFRKYSIFALAIPKRCVSSAG